VIVILLAAWIGLVATSVQTATWFSAAFAAAAKRLGWPPPRHLPRHA